MTTGFPYDEDNYWLLYVSTERQLTIIYARLPLRQRLKVLFDAATPLIWSSAGYLAFVILMQRFVGTTWAATVPGPVLGMSPYEWHLTVYLVYNAVVIIILLVLIGMIVAGSRSQWIWRMASFILGFLMRSITTFPTA
jgi:hypothetical protein